MRKTVDLLDQSRERLEFRGPRLAQQLKHRHFRVDRPRIPDCPMRARASDTEASAREDTASATTNTPNPAWARSMAVCATQTWASIPAMITCGRPPS